MILVLTLIGLQGINFFFQIFRKQIDAAQALQHFCIAKLNADHIN